MWDPDVFCSIRTFVISFLFFSLVLYFLCLSGLLLSFILSTINCNINLLCYTKNRVSDTYKTQTGHSKHFCTTNSMWPHINTQCAQHPQHVDVLNTYSHENITQEISLAHIHTWEYHACSQGCMHMGTYTYMSAWAHIHTFLLVNSISWPKYDTTQVYFMEYTWSWFQGEEIEGI